MPAFAGNSDLFAGLGPITNVLKFLRSLPEGSDRLVANIRDIEAALGDGTKRVYEGELEPRRRLRRYVSTQSPALPC